jgi:hypothetical protein
MDGRIRLHIGIDKEVVRKAHIALVPGIHEYRAGTVNKGIMIDNDSLEDIVPESKHGARGIYIGTVFNKQCVQVGKTIEYTCATPARLTVHIDEVTIS